MRAILFERQLSSPPVWDKTTGHASWSIGETIREKELLKLSWQPLGWGDEWEFEMFLHSHVSPNSPSSERVLWLFTEEKNKQTLPSPVRAPLGGHIDMMVPTAPLEHILLEVKGPGLKATDRPGTQAIDYLKKYKPLAVAAVGLGEKDADDFGPYDPVSWWDDADEDVSCARLTLLGLRVGAAQLALCAFDKARDAKSFLRGKEIVIPKKTEELLLFWKRTLSTGKKLTDTERRSLRVELGRTDGKTDTDIRWAIRLFEEHVFLICQFEPPDSLKQEMLNNGWFRLEKGSSANYESYRKCLGALKDAPDSEAALRTWIKAHLPGGADIA
jgi:hypothetical protein